MAIHVVCGNGPPTTIPPNKGAHYVDETNGITYLATDTTAVSDWKVAGGSFVTNPGTGTTGNLTEFADASGQIIQDSGIAASQVTDNETDISTNAANIATNTGDIATNTAAIALNTAKVSADGSIDTHSDVDTTTSAPGLNQFLQWDGSNWVPGSPTAAPVDSVNGQTGVVVLDTDDVSEGVTNLYYTEARVSANSDVTANTAKVSADGSIDTHSDVDTTTVTPSNGDNLQWDGSNFVPVAPVPAPVDSVNGQTGAVVLDTDDISEGSSNLYYTEARVSSNATVVNNAAQNTGTVTVHSDVTSAGSGQIITSAERTAYNTHIADTNNPHDTTIANLDDTNVSPADNDVLFFNNGASEWNSAQVYTLPKSMAIVSNTDITTNLNILDGLTFTTDVPINGTTVRLDSDFSISGAGIQCDFDGTVICFWSVDHESFSSRVNILTRLKNNGTIFGPVSASSYIRSSSGHNRADSKNSHIFSVSNGDVLTVGSTREAGAGTATMTEVGTSFLTLLRIE